MNAEIISVGTELLLGDILNTNAQYLSRRLADYGIPMFHQSVVGDNGLRLKNEFKDGFSRCDLIITSGGLGPTSDDITKETAAEFFNKPMVLHQDTMEKLEDTFSKQNRVLSESNKKQAYFPEGCTILPNDHGTAPGCIINENGKILVVLPGPPREIEPMFENYVIPYIENITENVIVSKILRVSGLGESLMAEQVQDIIDTSFNPTVAPYAKTGESILRITAHGKSKEECANLILPVEEKIRKRLGINIYGTGETSLEEVVGEILLNKKMTLSSAESCTGGLVAAKLINYPGISNAFLEGCVTYSNNAKIKRLGVKAETLDKFGAVSAETAMEMAEGIAKTSSTDIGISTTGIAGPSGDSKDKPVGLVYIGLYIQGTVSFIKVNFSGDREKIRTRATLSALDYLRRELLKI